MVDQDQNFDRDWHWDENETPVGTGIIAIPVQQVPGLDRYRDFSNIFLLLIRWNEKFKK